MEATRENLTSLFHGGESKQQKKLLLWEAIESHMVDHHNRYEKWNIKTKRTNKKKILRNLWGHNKNLNKILEDLRFLKICFLVLLSRDKLKTYNVCYSDKLYRLFFKRNILWHVFGYVRWENKILVNMIAIKI